MLVTSSIPAVFTDKDACSDVELLPLRIEDNVEDNSEEEGNDDKCSDDDDVDSCENATHMECDLRVCNATEERVDNQRSKNVCEDMVGKSKERLLSFPEDLMLTRRCNGKH